MTAAAPQYPPTPMMQAPPPPQGPSKAEPWGSEDPLMWCARKVRRLTLMSSASIAFLILLFGAGMYTLFTIVIYEGEEQLEAEGAAGLILLLITPLALAIAGGIMTAILAKNVGRLAKQPGAPSGASMAKLVLWLSSALWFFLFIVFFIAILTTAEGGEEGSDGDFPVGLLTILPVYMGLCLAVFTSGAALAAASEENRLESFLVLGLGWAAFIVFLILPAMISSWNIGSGNETIDWDSVTFWLRFGNLFPAVLPWLIVLALNWTHVRSINILGASGTVQSVTTFGAASNGSRGNGCDRCGGALSVHPKTQEVFCTACGAGLASEEIVVEAGASADLFVEQQRPPEPTLEPAPTHTVPPPVAAPVHAEPEACTICGGKLATLTMSQQLYCTGCGAGLPGKESKQPAGPEQQAPSPQPAPQAPLNAQIQQPPASQPVQQAPPLQQVQPQPQVRSQPPQAPVVPPAQPPAAPRAPGKCSNCGGAMTVHPRTKEMFCPACGAGLSQEPHVPWPPP
ncbi:MAG: hypothetical protein KAS77_06435 [Thermoplasmata archaeon]|nr:hypothetical protein [Thermoplasmata archaeon]